MTVGTTRLDLTRTELELLVALMAFPESVRSRVETERKVWGEAQKSGRRLAVQMSRLRRKILEADGPSVLVAVRGVGYRLAV